MFPQNLPVPQMRVMGAFEPVNFPEFGPGFVKAKVDTGAYTGALHCALIEERTSDEGKMLAFRPLEGRLEIIKDEFVVKYVRSSNGKREKRYFVTTTIMIQGCVSPITLSLTDRSDMRWQVLIGRRFLQKQGFLIDPKRTNGYVGRAGGTVL
jgi:hypothetical protein